MVYVARQVQHRAVTAIDINAYKGAWKKITYNIYLGHKALATWYRSTALELYLVGTYVSLGSLRLFMRIQG
jgi:hypothetical protein